MLNLEKDFCEMLNSPGYARIVTVYNRGMITLDEAVREIYRANERSQKETAARLRRENRANAKKGA